LLDLWGQQAQKVNAAIPGPQVHRALKVIKATLDQRDRAEKKAILVHAVNPVHAVKLVPLDRKGCRVIRVLKALWVQPDQQVLPVIRVLLDRKVIRAKKATSALLAPKAKKATSDP
jgi:hypothetical protein